MEKSTEKTIEKRNQRKFWNKLIWKHARLTIVAPSDELDCVPSPLPIFEPWSNVPVFKVSIAEQLIVVTSRQLARKNRYGLGVGVGEWISRGGDADSFDWTGGGVWGICCHCSSDDGEKPNASTNRHGLVVEKKILLWLKFDLEALLGLCVWEEFKKRRK